MLQFERMETRTDQDHHAVVIHLFFFNDTATTEIYTLSLHDALPIWINRTRGSGPHLPSRPGPCVLLTLLEPITLSARESNNRAFTAQLNPTQPGKKFQLTISAAPPFEPGKAQAQITLKTSSTKMPLITISRSEERRVGKECRS